MTIKSKTGVHYTERLGVSIDRETNDHARILMNAKKISLSALVRLLVNQEFEKTIPGAASGKPILLAE